jgi:hypothetical protein
MKRRLRILRTSANSRILAERHLGREVCRAQHFRDTSIVPIYRGGPREVPQIRPTQFRARLGQLPLQALLIPTLHSLPPVIRSDPLVFGHVPSQPGKKPSNPNARHTCTCSCSSAVRPDNHEGPLFLYKGSPPAARGLNHPGPAADRDRKTSAIVRMCVTTSGVLP